MLPPHHTVHVHMVHVVHIERLWPETTVDVAIHVAIAGLTRLHLLLKVGLRMHVHHSHLHGLHGELRLVHETWVSNVPCVVHGLLHTVAIHVQHVHVVTSDHISSWLNGHIWREGHIGIDSDIGAFLVG